MSVKVILEEKPGAVYYIHESVTIRNNHYDWINPRKLYVNADDENDTLTKEEVLKTKLDELQKATDALRRAQMEIYKKNEDPPQM